MRRIFYSFKVTRFSIQFINNLKVREGLKGNKRVLISPKRIVLNFLKSIDHYVVQICHLPIKIQITSILIAFTMEQDIPDYDMDSDDERWLQSQTQKLDLSPLKFEEMMDRLEKSSGQTVVTLNEAKALLKEDDDLIIAVFDYWLNKRLKTVRTNSIYII